MNIILVYDDSRLAQSLADIFGLICPDAEIHRVTFAIEAITAVAASSPCVIITGSSTPHTGENQSKTTGIRMLAKAVRKNPLVRTILADTDFWDLETTLFNAHIDLREKGSFEQLRGTVLKFKKELSRA